MLQSKIEAAHGEPQNAAYPYLETPYSNVDQDSLKLLSDYKMLQKNARTAKKPPPLVGNMLSGAFKKVKYRCPG